MWSFCVRSNTFVCIKTRNKLFLILELSTTGCKFNSKATCKGGTKWKPGTCTQVCIFYEISIKKEFQLPGDVQDKCRSKGHSQVKCSELLAQEDIKRFNGQLKASLKEFNKIYWVDPYILAGIISRESRAGKALNSRGWGDCRYGKCKAYGAMQVDVTYGFR